MKTAMLAIAIAVSALMAIPAVSADDADTTESCRPTVYPDGSATVTCSGTPLSGCVWVQTHIGPGYYVCFTQ